MAAFSLPQDLCSVHFPAPGISGVYILLHEGQVVYVGQAGDLRKRLGDHLRDGSKKFDSFSYIHCGARELAATERFLIAFALPLYNACAFTARVRRLRDSAPDRIATELEMFGDYHVCLQGAAIYLGMTTQALTSLGERGPEFVARRHPVSRSRYRAYSPVSLITFANERAAQKAA